MLKTLRKSISTVITATLAFGFLAISPQALAVGTVVIANDPLDLFNYTEDSKISFTVGMQNNDNNAQNVEFSIKGPLGENSEKTTVVANHVYNGNLAFIFDWNGKINNQFVTPGNYEAQFKGPNTAIHPFKVVSAEPILGFNPNPATTYTVGSGNYDVSASLTGIAANTNVDMYVVDKQNFFSTKVDSDTYTSNTTLQFTWDGKLNGNQPNPGNFEVRLSGKDVNGNPTNAIVFPFTVQQQNVAKADLQFVSNPDDEIGEGVQEYGVNVRLSDYTSNTNVIFAVENPNSGLLVPEDNFTYTFEDQTHIFSFDPSDLDPGNYDFTVYSEDSSKADTLTGDFTIVDGSEGECAGYSDVSKNDPYCKAIENAQEEGWMTGENDGETFNPNGEFNRAAMAKVVLLAYNKYNENTDYCNGTNPFTDTFIGNWYTNFVCRGKTLGMINGYSAPDPRAGQYGPENAVTVPEAMCLFLRPLNESMPAGKSYVGLANNLWYSGCAAYAKNHDLYPGNNVSPTQTMRREEVAQFLWELEEAGKIN